MDSVGGTSYAALDLRVAVPANMAAGNYSGTITYLFSAS